MFFDKESSVRRKLKNVSVSKELLVRYIDEIDSDGDGNVSLGEVGAALVFLWKKAKGKLKQPKEVKSKVVVLK